MKRMKKVDTTQQNKFLRKRRTNNFFQQKLFISRLFSQNGRIDQTENLRSKIKRLYRLEIKKFSFKKFVRLFLGNLFLSYFWYFFLLTKTFVIDLRKILFDRKEYILNNNLKYFHFTQKRSNK